MTRENELVEYLKKLRDNEFVNFFDKIGEIIKYHREKNRLKLRDVSKMIKERFNVEIHPSILSRYENQKLPVKSNHAAYIFSVLNIYLEDVFINRVISVNFQKLYTNPKFQFLISKLKDFFNEDEIINMINSELQLKLDYAYKVIDSLKKKPKTSLEVSDEPKKN